jgi:hypothetical protein
LEGFEEKINTSMLLCFVENSNGYESVFPENHPYLKSDIIYVLDLGKEKNKELMKKFPDRKPYILDSNSIRELKK